ncbi:hypothetical protein LTR62_001272 [Meristemomyces frigidus]|uniref:Uncharacterized protein n=1 Tax=Meristemomyces frigidus TaxID=1508187 RepID=A0AAN7T8L9_9PEZI|nr:hypothetical protein LTR62_001272 [Meristemomyces frigidus]
MEPGGSLQVPQKRAAQPRVAPSKLQKSSDSRQSTPRSNHLRTSLDDAASSPSYIDAICAVLDGHSDGLGKEQVISQVLERCGELWPTRAEETVKRGLGVAFSAAPNSKVPRIYAWESVNSAGHVVKIWTKSAPQEHQQDHVRPDGVSTIHYGPPYNSPDESVTVRAQVERSIPVRQAPSEILTNHIESLLNNGGSPVSAHLWRAADANALENVQSAAVSLGDANDACDDIPPAEDTQGGGIANDSPKTTSADATSHTGFAQLETDMVVAQLQCGMPPDSPTTDVEDSSSNLEILRWGQQVKRRKALVPKLHTWKERSSLLSDKTKEIRQTQEHFSARISELEQQLRNAREHASDLAGQYKDFACQAQDVAKTIDNMEDEIRGIDRELLQS